MKTYFSIEIQNTKIPNLLDVQPQTNWGRVMAMILWDSSHDLQCNTTTLQQTTEVARHQKRCHYSSKITPYRQLCRAHILISTCISPHSSF